MDGALVSCGGWGWVVRAVPLDQASKALDKLLGRVVEGLLATPLGKEVTNQPPPVP